MTRLLLAFVLGYLACFLWLDHLFGGSGLRVAVTARRGPGDIRFCRRGPA